MTLEAFGGLPFRRLLFSFKGRQSLSAKPPALVLQSLKTAAGVISRLDVEVLNGLMCLKVRLQLDLALFTQFLQELPVDVVDARTNFFDLAAGRELDLTLLIGLPGRRQRRNLLGGGDDLVMRFLQIVEL